MDLEHAFAKSMDELPGIDRADAADHAGAQVLLDALNCRRSRDLEERRPELDAVDAVVDPGAACLNELAGRNHRGVAEHSNQITLAARLDAQHTKSVLLVMERDPLDEASQEFRGRARLCSLEHAHEP